MPESQSEFIQMKLREITSDLEHEPKDSGQPSETLKLQLLRAQEGQVNKMYRRRTSRLL